MDLRADFLVIGSGTSRFLLSEALRGEGARLVNEAGERFMTRYEPSGDLASRDLVSRAIVREMDRTGAPVYLSLAHMDPAFVHRRFPTISEACARAGLDLARDRIPVSPPAHCIMGGVQTDLDGRTSIDGLFAAGEAACTGVQQAVARLELWDSCLRMAASPAPADSDFRRVRTLVTVGLMIARAALRREESRGGHFRSDFPNRNDIQ